MKRRNFTHLKKGFDEKTSEMQKKWNFSPDTFNLSNELLYDLKIVGDMEEDIGKKKDSKHDLENNRNLKEKEFQKISQRYENLTSQKEELEKLKEQETGAEKLKKLVQKQKDKKENAQRETGKHNIYGERIQEFLGLRMVETTSNSTVLIFNNIDKCDVNREFLCEFTLFGPDQRSYKVLKCEPMLDNLVDLENTLNATNDLSGFVTKLRTKFQHYSLTNV